VQTVSAEFARRICLHGDSRAGCDASDSETMVVPRVFGALNISHSSDGYSRVQKANHVIFSSAMLMGHHQSRESNIVNETENLKKNLKIPTG